MSNLEHYINEITNSVGLDGILKDNKKQYETDWRNRYHNPCLAVIFPSTIEQVCAVIKISSIYKVGIIPQGGNTSLCGASVPNDSNKSQIILNLRRLDKIINIDINNQSITVEAGCTLDKVIEYARTNGLYFPLSIASRGSCQIGGNIATNAGGVHVIKYGMMQHLVLGLEVCLHDGSIINQLYSLHKNNTFFDLKQLFIGSEGTLGVITKATLKLYQQPESYFTAMCGVNDLSTACLLLNLLNKYYSLCAFEIINHVTGEIHNKHFHYIGITAPWIILFEIETNSEFSVEELVHKLSELAIDLDSVILASNENERQNLWHIRENIPLAEKMEGIAVKHDISLPVSSVEDFIRTNESNILKHYPNAQIIIFGHLGDGNLHYNIQFKNMDHNKLQNIESEINNIVYTDVHRYNGSFSAEHGIGMLKKHWLSKYYDSRSYQLALSIKKLLDPNNILNPEKVF